jgi:putative FmdB family regulatory protein
MVTREYECKNCNRRFELEQRISEPRPSTCPKCGADGQYLTALLSPSNFVLRDGGVGWGRDNYAGKGDK